MNRETYDALVASVEKWRKNATVPPSEGLIGVGDCPLCELFWLDRCLNCPVADATGRPYCWDTPYPDANDAQEFDDEDAWKAAAQREADFLAALVPAGGPDE